MSLKNLVQVESCTSDRTLIDVMSNMNMTCELCCSLFAFFDEGLEPKISHERYMNAVYRSVSHDMQLTNAVSDSKVWKQFHGFPIKIFLVS